MLCYAPAAKGFALYFPHFKLVQRRPCTAYTHRIFSRRLHFPRQTNSHYRNNLTLCALSLSLPILCLRCNSLCVGAFCGKQHTIAIASAVRFLTVCVCVCVLSGEFSVRTCHRGMHSFAMEPDSGRQCLPIGALRSFLTSRQQECRGDGRLF